MTSAITALIRPPRLKSMCRGATLARSYAGETKLATTLIPTVATAKVTAPSSRTHHVVDAPDDLDRVGDVLPVHRERPGGHQHRHYREGDEVDGQAPEVADH